MALVGCRPREPEIDYAALAAELPSLDDLAQRATAFQSTLIYDREGNLLSETFDPNAGKRIVVPLERISPYLQQATIATEDANYYEHGGVDPVAIARAAWYLVREGHPVSGGSTIPQQLVKRLYLSPERSVKRKVVEAALAREISKRYTKEQILALYLNEIYYGHLAYGAEAAARTYFRKHAADLSLAEAALLAGLPQAPAYHDPYAHPERAKERQRVVLGLMVKAGFISRSQAESAYAEPLAFAEPRFELVAPHFTLFVREQVEAMYGPEALYSRGLSVYTTLDRHLQAQAEAAVREHVATLAQRGATNGALVAMRPESGEILALVGSADFHDEAASGQINMAVAPRQPGSAIKPLVYLAAFEELGWTPGTLLADIAVEFPNGANPPYVPTNYDGKEHGLVTLRAALANSYNIPAVRTLQAVGLPKLKEVAARLGITTLTRDDYGLSLALGSGEVPLVQLVAVYGVLANGGRRVPTTAIARIADGQGETLCEIATTRPCVPGTQGIRRQQVVDPVDAFLLTDILSDNVARRPAFGSDNWLEIGRPAAVKTGTTNDTRDGWTIGYTPELVAGVWVGNADNRPMRGVSGYYAAAPIWNRFMKAALRESPVRPFAPPPGVRQFEVCADTGTLPSPACPERRSWWFAERRPPLPADQDLWQLFGGQPFKAYPAEYREWAEAHGIPQPPPGMLPDGAPDEEVPTLEPPTDTATPTWSAVTPTATATPWPTTPTVWPTSTPAAPSLTPGPMPSAGPTWPTTQPPPAPSETPSPVGTESPPTAEPSAEATRAPGTTEPPLQSTPLAVTPEPPLSPTEVAATPEVPLSPTESPGTPQPPP